MPDADVRAAAHGRRNVDLARLRRRPTAAAAARDVWIRSAMEARTTLDYEERLVGADGTVREVVRSAVPILFESGEVDFVVAFTVDFTARKRYEQSLMEAKEEAEELARLKSTFLANMSHEVRTPLAGIIGFAEVLVDELDETHREAAQLIRQSGMRLLDTLNSVLDLARLEANAVDLDLSRLDLGPEAVSTSRLFQGMASTGTVALVVEAPPSPVWAMIDGRAFHRVLVNLVSNAVKFTNKGEVRISVAEEGGEAVVRVADTGVGIDAAFLPHVFAEFRQESAGLTRSHQGSGLGLAITRRLVGLMHGRIEVESVKGEGATFTVRFPLADAPQHVRT